MEGTAGGPPVRHPSMRQQESQPSLEGGTGREGQGQVWAWRPMGHPPQPPAAAQIWPRHPAALLTQGLNQPRSGDHAMEQEVLSADGKQKQSWLGAKPSPEDLCMQPPHPCTPPQALHVLQSPGEHPANTFFLRVSNTGHGGYLHDPAQ